MINPHTFKYWIFDLDGTLTKPILDFPKIKKRMGLPADRGILEVMSEMEAEKAQELAELLEQIELEYALKAQAAPGAHQLLNILEMQNIPMGILTRNKKSHALETLKILGFQTFFDDPFILGRDEAKPKPDPDGVLKLLSGWQAQPEEAVFVGDFKFDLIAGRTAGTATIHVNPDGVFPFGKWSDWDVKGLDVIAAQFNQS